MATRNFVPRNDNEGCIGISSKRWANGYIINMQAETLKADNIETSNLVSNGTSINIANIPQFPNVTTLPTTASLGDKVFNVSNDRIYIYTSAGWRALPYLDEIMTVLDGNSDISLK